MSIRSHFDASFDVFDADYFMNGKESGKSLYSNYRWLPMLTIPFCVRIAQHLGMEEADSVLDFGCSRGYSVRAFRALGFDAWGVDASRWAVHNCDPNVKDHIHHRTCARRPHDWIIAKDVLEHIPEPELSETIANLIDNARKGLFVVVPLSPADDEPYVVPEYEQDVTHVNRWCLDTWVTKLTAEGFCTSAVYRIPGIKENYWREGFEEANGFITIRRAED